MRRVVRGHVGKREHYVDMTRRRACGLFNCVTPSRSG
jgi:hypothetical protein